MLPASQSLGVRGDLLSLWSADRVALAGTVMFFAMKGEKKEGGGGGGGGGKRSYLADRS